MSRNFLNDTYSGYDAYIPGEQPSEEGWIKLNSNENPYPPSDKVKTVLLELAENPARLKKYPSPSGEPLRSAIAQKYNLDPTWVHVMNGSDEALALLCRICLNPGDAVVTPEITYSLYDILVSGVDARLLKVPMKSTTTTDLPELLVDLEAMEKTSAKLVILPNPNAPTGEFIQTEKIISLIKNSDKLWVIDEAYNDFVEEKNSSFLSVLSKQKNSITQDLDNLIIMRTFSKSYSLAGARIGYAVSANARLNDAIQGAKDSYNEDVIALEVGKAALGDDEWFNRTISKVNREKKILMEELAKSGFMIMPSQANFFMARPPRTISAKSLYEKLKDRKILIRFFNKPFLDQYVRISIGNEDENKKLITEIQNIVR